MSHSSKSIALSFLYCRKVTYTFGVTILTCTLSYQEFSLFKLKIKCLNFEIEPNVNFRFSFHGEARGWSS